MSRHGQPPNPGNVSDDLHGAANADDPTIAAAIAGLASADFTRATLQCDLVLKGGVTSGIVYPTAICRLADGARALTFFDLWGGTGTPRDIADNERKVDLLMMTTNVTLGRPHRIPFDADDFFAFYFDPAEFAKVFPAGIVAQMVTASRPAPCRAWPNLRTFPKAWDLPVVVAARMSMSFPLLFSAIPIYVKDKVRNDTRTRPVVRCLLSDGGLTSNMPLHFFDGPYPRWPTFAIDLRGIPERLKHPVPAPDRLAFMADAYPQDHNEIGNGASGIVSFAMSIVRTMQTWNDAVTFRVPGNSDRTVQIALNGVEGGLNLGMSPETRKMLAQRGYLAGTIIDTKFALNGKRTRHWERHRERRARSFLAMAEGLGTNHNAEWNYDYSPGPSEQVLTNALPVPSPQFARDLETAFATASDDHPIARAAQKPYPELRTRSRV